MSTRTKVTRRLSLSVLCVCLSLAAPAFGTIDELEAALGALAADLVSEMGEGEVKKLAVVEFSDLNGYQSTLGQFIAEELLTHFARSGAGLDLVERHQLARVLSEQELTSNALFDSSTIVEIGRMLGIDALVTGSIAILGDQVKVNARAISVETARVFAASSCKVKVDDSIKLLMNQSAGGGRAGASLAPSRSGLAQSADTYFQNDFLRAEVASIGKTETGEEVVLAIVLENLSQEDLLLVIDDYYCKLGLIDNHGNSASDEDVVGLPCLHSSMYDRGHRYSAIGPRSKTTLTVSFDFRQPVEGTVFSFSMQLVRHLGDTYRKFSVGIPGIEL